jgi:copper chaperone CopZ
MAMRGISLATMTAVLLGLAGGCEPQTPEATSMPAEEGTSGEMMEGSSGETAATMEQPPNSYVAMPGVTPASSLVFNVPDMHCEFACAPKVRKTLADVPGLVKVETNVAASEDARTATLYVTEEFDKEKALAALEEAGYPATEKQKS